MRMYDIIEKKRDGLELNQEEMHFVIKGFTAGEIPDYQMSAFLMAIFLKGMSEEETFNLTMEMMHSGEILDLSGIEGVKVDKHSTGGVGDKTTLVLGPMVAACGVPVAKLSGRGLGHTGGTIDKLESFMGFSSSIPRETFIKNVNDIKIAIAGQTANLAPADKKIYALRDVTATVNSIPLIASSIMSKKLASGADAIVLDVKCGNGAFMEDEESATILAQEMVKIGKRAGKNIVALITDMNQPLGFSVGNALEVMEALDSLKGNGPEDLMELCYSLGAYMLVVAGKASDVEEGRRLLVEVITNNKAYEKMREFIENQGGNFNSLPDIANGHNVISTGTGYIKSIKTAQVGRSVMIMGGGRETKESIIDLSVGIEIHAKIGDMVNVGDSIATVYCNEPKKAEEAIGIILDAYEISIELNEKPTLIKKVIS